MPPQRRLRGAAGCAAAVLRWLLWAVQGSLVPILLQVKFGWFLVPLRQLALTNVCKCMPVSVDDDCCAPSVRNRRQLRMCGVAGCEVWAWDEGDFVVAQIVCGASGAAGQGAMARQHNMAAWVLFVAGNRPR